MPPTTGSSQTISCFGFPLRWLEAEPIRDAMLFVAGTLDMTVGGKSFETGKTNSPSNRRTAFMSRGYQSFSDALPDYLQTFDAEDGRAVCPRRNQTVTAPQALFMMNDELAESASSRFADRLKNHSAGDLPAAVTLGYRIAPGRPANRVRSSEGAGLPTQGDSGRVKGFAWLLLNLMSFVCAVSGKKVFCGTNK